MFAIVPQIDLTWIEIISNAQSADLVLTAIKCDDRDLSKTFVYDLFQFCWVSFYIGGWKVQSSTCGNEEEHITHIENT